MTVRTPHASLFRLPSALAAGAVLAFTTTAGADGGDGGVGHPDTIDLEGVARDFREHRHEGGHPDFERRPDLGFGLYCGNIAPVIGTDRKPMFTGEGFKVTQQWHDSFGRPICHLLYDAALGDSPGSTGGDSAGGIASAESFAQWYDDVPGVNMSKNLTLTLHHAGGGVYVFDDRDDPLYSSLDGFFPLEDQLLGNPGGSPDRNFHFTFEMHTEFVYRADESQIFRFIGDDDVWVFINDRLVIDLGGVHSAKQQTVDLTRLDLVDGETYTLDFFFAERHRTESNFRIETNLLLRTVVLPPITAAYD
jgi:fibro-slime domain-containing protein